MAKKLENLDITSVDFVPKGANPKADILVTKNNKTDGVLEKLAKALASVFGEKTEDVEKEAATFSEVITEHQVYLILDEVRAASCALTCSFESILSDEEVVDKASTLNQSLAEFNAAMQEYIQKWASGQLVGIAKTEGEAEKADAEPVEQKEETDVNIDKSKLTAEELEFLAKIEEKAGIVAATQDDVAPASEVAPETDDVAKSDTNDVLTRFDGIMKALDATVAKIEDDKLAAVAKKYGVLGMKEEELVPFFKELKKDPKMYDSIIQRFDAAVAAVEASGVFDEIGKRGAESVEGCAVVKIAKFADEIQKQNPGMGRVKAEQTAWEQHPELVAEYEAQA
ncbi:MAG: hypothetical protein IJ741_03635 [Schwartzia sp.]|nr:hypothetical protein [Schwartzia sp. (in: firmicutes)]